MCHTCDSELKERLTLRLYVLFILLVSYHKAKSQWSLTEGGYLRKSNHVFLPLRRPDSSISWQIIHRVQFQFYDMRSSMLSLNVPRVI